ncbi:hypothetical protein MESS2_540011 [Mesorhizobium metallidurans STM 2683]|uniref:Uncharacterized protein n=1 Tax=Mesorhizobium metallidurans STM 2683 TaxID=1297569 RepID=M5ERE4_9HYPH|nr:hypothetical protein MESS2_540011 [Mesorhizobium metallidurans STM 2683]
MDGRTGQRREFDAVAVKVENKGVVDDVEEGGENVVKNGVRYFITKIPDSDCNHRKHNNWSKFCCQCCAKNRS